MKFDKKELFTVPNILTYIRLLCVPFFVWLILDKSISNNVMIAFGIFMFASLTDLIDGFIARKCNMISDIGKILDPIADKMLQVSTLICLTVIGNLWLVFPIIFIIKETYMVLGGSAVVKLFRSKFVIQSNIYGKIATCVNTLGIVLAFFHMPEYHNLYYIDVVVLSIGAVCAIFSAVNYTVKFFKFRKIEKAGLLTESGDNDSSITKGNENV